MRQDTFKRLDQDFQQHPVTVAGPVLMSEVNELESQVGFKLPEAYKEFVARYGGAIVGPYSIYGIKASAAMGNGDSAWQITQRFRKQNWRGADKWLVFSMDQAGNPIGLDSNGKVWISDHDAGVVEIIAESFEDYLRIHCLKAAD